ncbi:MAG: hypothetical protein Q4C91_16520 [Eubacteriales bacterium]|nr:hypothetical protein [Eubacteriales bacterium]
MNVKRICAVVMTVLLVMSLLPSAVFAAAGKLDGKLKLKGSASVGSTLSANYEKAEPEGLTDEDVSFSWVRKPEDGESKEVGTGKTYTVAQEDEGSKIVLTITGIEEKGLSGTLTASTETISAAAEEETSGEEESWSEEYTEEQTGETEEYNAEPEETQEEIPEEPQNAEEPQNTEEPQSAEEPQNTAETQQNETAEEEWHVDTYEEETNDAADKEEETTIPDNVSEEEPVTIGTDTDGSEQNAQSEPQNQDEEGKDGTNSGEAEPAAEGGAISIAPETLTFEALKEGYQEVTQAQTVTVTNTGDAAITLAQPKAQYFDITAVGASATDNIRLEKGGSCMFLVAPAAGLAAGTYSDELIFGITEDESKQAKVTASVEVKAELPKFTADPSNIVFGSYTEGEDDTPEVQTITVTNNTEEAVILKQPAGEVFQAGALSAETLEAGKTVTFTLQPKTGLEAGEYKETISISKVSEAGQTEELTSVTAELTVTVKEPVYQLDVEPDMLDFGSSEEGYDTAPEAQKVTITNTGDTEITLEQPKADFFNVSELSATVVKPGESVSFTVRPKTGLEESDYLEVIEIPNEAGVQCVVNAAFSVADAGNKLIEIQKTADIKGLANGTKKTAEALKLPASVVLRTTEGKVKAKVSWDVKSSAYDPGSTEAQSFSVKGKVTLPEGVTNPDDISLITSVKVSVQGYTPKVASADDNKITGIDSSKGYVTRSKISFTAVGAGMDNTNPGKGDVRYVPLNWTVINTNSWTEAPYSATFGLSQSGDYTLSVVFNRQKFDGSNWTNTGEQDTKKVSFHVSQAQPTATPSAINRSDATRKNAVQTGDTTNVVPFVAALILAVVCVGGIIIYRRKK